MWACVIASEQTPYCIRFAHSSCTASGWTAPAGRVDPTLLVQPAAFRLHVQAAARAGPLAATPLRFGLAPASSRRAAPSTGSHCPGSTVRPVMGMSVGDGDGAPPGDRRTRSPPAARPRPLTTAADTAAGRWRRDGRRQRRRRRRRPGGARTGVTGGGDSGAPLARGRPTSIESLISRDFSFAAIAAGGGGDPHAASVAEAQSSEDASGRPPHRTSHRETASKLWR